MPDAMLEREWLAPFHVDVRLTLAVQGRGRGDPTFRADAGAIWRTSLTPDGPGTIQVMPVAVRDGPLEGEAGGELGGPEASRACKRVRARAWGPGASWLLDALPAALGLDDDISGFDP